MGKTRTNKNVASKQALKHNSMLAIRLDSKLHKQAKILAVTNGESLAQLVARALQRECETCDQKQG